MKDPVGAFDSVRHSLVDYVRTAFGTQFDGVERERERLLYAAGAVCQEPWIEPLPRYESSGKTAAALTLDDVPGLGPDALADFKSLVGCGLVAPFDLHLHQLEMLRKVTGGKNATVTAGTGSGKTESFLLPVFAYLARESRQWTTPGPRPEHIDDWWLSDAWRAPCDPSSTTSTGKIRHKMVRSLRVGQRSHETRPAAMRALVLYPMNALVEDQLSRLRRSLDSPLAREWMASNRPGNRIYFGRYTSATPVPGHELRPPNSKGERSPDRSRILDLTAELRRTAAAAQIAAEHAERTGRDDISYFFPRLDGAEMRSRWDMQDTPPDILITNYSMLSVMLMREADERIFDQTRQWLAADDSIFHLIIDELHLYRGTAGTEVAYLLRLLLHRLGLTPDSPKLRILASSASLEPDDPSSLEYLHQFFGVAWEPDQVIPGRLSPVPPPLAGHLSAQVFTRLSAAIDVGSAVLDAAAGDSAAELGGTDGASGLSRLAHILAASDEVGFRMLDACRDPTGGTMAVSLPQFAASIFGNSVGASVGRSAARGLLFARALIDEYGLSTQLPAFRLHWFFRNIEGLWACTCPGCGVSPDDSEPDRAPGQLFLESRLLCLAKDQHRVLELLYCEQCGTTCFGGSKLTIPSGGGWELLTTDPDIEGIPDKQAARLVERRNHQEFAVFWPGGDLNPDATQWRQPAFESDAATGRWLPASLDTRTGRAQLGNGGTLHPHGSWIRGFFFVATGADEEAVLALPAACPRCGADYSHRKVRKSPIRGFRTGFSKLTQLLSKELFHFLPSDARKLVIFSDSREEAAALSNGIERSHYLDLVREAMYDELSRVVLGEPALLTDVEHGDHLSPVAQRYADSHPGAADRIAALVADASMPTDDLNPRRRAILVSARAAADAEIASIKQREAARTVPLRILFEGPGPDGPGELTQRLKTLGVNPGGNDVLYQDYKYDGSYHRWTNLFDFSSPASGWRDDLSPEARERGRERLRRKVASEVCSVLFSRLYFGFESAGLGYPRLELTTEDLADLSANLGCQPDLLARIADSTIRVMGDLYRYRQEDPDAFPVHDWPGWSSARAPLRNFVRECATTNGLGEGVLADALWEAICVRAGHHYLVIDPRRLAVRIALPSDPVWVCTSCRRPHLHRAGPCTATFCLRELPLDPELTCSDLHSRNYYAKEAVDLRQPLRMHCEELTAQTDDQAERQRLFRGIVVNLDRRPTHALVEHVDEVDLLGVTTTMEVGVDIGALQAVVLGNMPPQRFNYQQRSGRAGRRGQAFAVVLTLCRGRSHDEFYYRHPERITRDRPPVPFLSLNRPEIAQRLMAKESLRQAFRSAGVRWWESPSPPDSHGEFGLFSDWRIDSARRDAVRDHLESAAGIQEVAVALAMPQSHSVNPGSLETFARVELSSRMESALANPEVSGKGVAERLAEAAVLPMFGMPSRVRLLYHQIAGEMARTIDRDLDLAITEFAPGSQRTKDKRVYQAIGFTASLLYMGHWTAAEPDPIASRRWMARCERCHYIRTTDEEPIDTLCPQCGCTTEDKPGFAVFRIAVPIAFRTDLGPGGDAREDEDIVGGGAASVAESQAQAPDPVTGTNTALALTELGRVYRINTRRGELFAGSVGTTSVEHQSLEHQWIETRFEAGQRFTFHDQGPSETFALAAPKTTDVLRIRPVFIPPGLALDPFTRGGAKKASYYSAAFLLRAVAAELLDIDPDELEISDVRQIEGPDASRLGEVVISDHLANGAGFSAWIHRNWTDVLDRVVSLAPPPKTFTAGLISETHQQECDSAGYDCLRQYRNMSYHGILDWRLGLALTRCLADPNYVAGLDGGFQLPELAGWPALARSRRDAFCASFGGTPRDFGPLVGFDLAQMQVIVVHPMWSVERPHGILADALASTDPGTVRFVDTFNLMRREGWCYRSLAAP